jgi:hypothetical protein
MKREKDAVNENVKNEVNDERQIENWVVGQALA